MIQSPRSTFAYNNIIYFSTPVNYNTAPADYGFHSLSHTI